MTMGQTTRMVLPYPEGTDTPDVPLDMKELADRLAAIAAGWLPSNTLANRPAPVAGLDRHLFYAHDQGEVSLCVDPGNDGSYTWITVYPVPQPDLSGYATDTELNNGLAGKSDTGHKHAAADVTSGTLALARLPVAASGASSATQVVRADDSRLSDARTPTAHTHDHGALNGLGDDDHPQYALADGSRGSFGATLIASHVIAAGENVAVVTFDNIPQTYRDIELRIRNLWADVGTTVGSPYMLQVAINGEPLSGGGPWRYIKAQSSLTGSNFDYLPLSDSIPRGSGAPPPTDRGFVNVTFYEYRSATLYTESHFGCMPYYPTFMRAFRNAISPGLTKLDIYGNGQNYGAGARFDLWGIK